MSALAGKRIVITRPRAQAGDLSEKLAALNAQPILFPTIEIAPMKDFTALDSAIGQLAAYHWVIFTSVNGVEAFWDRLIASGAGQLLELKTAAIGPATAQALERRGIHPAFLPNEYVGEAVAAGLEIVAGQRVLLPRADIAREALAVELARRGAVVDDVAAYRTLPAAPDPTGLTELRRGVDAVTFTSSSTVRNFVALLSGGERYVDTAAIRRMGRDGVPMPSLGRAAIACIGPITAQTAREAGLPVDVVAAEYTTGGLVAALAAYFAQPELAIKENRWIPQRSL